MAFKITEDQYNDIMDQLDQIHGDLRSLSIFAAQNLLRQSLMLPDPHAFAEGTLLNVASNLGTMHEAVAKGDFHGERVSTYAIQHFSMMAEQIRSAIATIPKAPKRQQ